MVLLLATPLFFPLMIPPSCPEPVGYGMMGEWAMARDKSAPAAGPLVASHLAGLVSAGDAGATARSMASSSTDLGRHLEV